jgi:16S rRNA (adenine1518-N6/adenine1519-N6)-dimethyltransferase
MNKAELLEILEEYNFHPGRFLGQNFLLDANLLDWIVRTIDPQPGELILEAGPGFGALTHGMLDAGAEVHAIEFDRRICEYLNKNMRQENFHLFEGDACRVDLDEITGGRDFRAAANLPYSISSVFIARLVNLAKPPREMIFMLQKEMGMRVSADINTRNYGSLSVRAQAVYDIKLLRKIPPQVFFPPPKVDSAIVRFIRKEEVPSVERRRRLDRVVKDAFSQRRKKMFKVLSKGRDAQQLENAFNTLGISFDARPGSLTTEKFLELADALGEAGAPGDGT